MSSPETNVIGFPVGQATASSPEAVGAALRAEHARHAAAVEAIVSGMAVGQGSKAGERRQTRKEAAGELGISVPRLMRLVIRFRELYPDRPRLGVQAADMKNSPWTIYTDRVRSVMESGEPY